MKNTIIILIVAVLAWLYIKQKKAAAANPGEKSVGLFGISGVVEGLSLAGIDSSTTADTSTTADSSTIKRISIPKPTPVASTFMFQNKTKSPFKWRNSER